MDRRAVLLTGVAALVVAPAAAEPIPLNRISAYFNALETVEARFTQFNGDGSISTGTLYIRRPGRMRFEYDPPEQALVMAGSGRLAVFDNRSNSVKPEEYPLRRTPLNILLEKQVDLAQRDVVVGHSGDAAATTVVARDPKNPDIGQMEFTFAEGPLRLAEWVTVDSLGARTRVVLTQLKTGGRLRQRLFNIPQEIQSRGG